MKKLVFLAAALLCLLLLAACHPIEVLDDVAQHVTNAAEQVTSAVEQVTDAVEQAVADGRAETTSGTDTADAENPDHYSRPEEEYEIDDEAYEPDEDREEEAPASDTDADTPAEPQSALPVEEVSADFTALSLEECVTDAEGAEDQLPHIILDCEGAEAINDDIEGSFRYLVDEDYCTLYYDCHKNGRVLSILIAQLYDGDASYYTPYNLDLLTGQQLSGSELLELLGADREAVTEAELSVMAREFEYRYGSASEGDSAAFYQEQYDRTVTEDNVDTGRLWLDGGSLKFVAKIYALAGAEFYEYPMDTGLTF